MSRPTENVHKGQLEHAGGEENWLAICPPSREREMEGGWVGERGGGQRTNQEDS